MRSPAGGALAACWSGAARLLRPALPCPMGSRGEGDSDSEADDEEQVNLLVYGDRNEAMSEIALEGGDGDDVLFFKVRPGTRAERAGVRPGDVVVQINRSDPEVLFERPADEILPCVVGPVEIWWRSAPPQDPGERTRIHFKRPIAWAWCPDRNDGLEPEPYPVSKSTTLEGREWRCGSCRSTNFDHQEICRTCGLRDSRLPPRPRVHEMPAHFNSRLVKDEPDFEAPQIFSTTGPSAKVVRDLRAAAEQGQRADPLGIKVERPRNWDPKRLK